MAEDRFISSHGGKLTRPQPPVKSQAWCPRNSLGHPLHAVFERRTGCLVAAMPECLKQPVTEDLSLPFFIAFQRPSAFHKWRIGSTAVLRGH